jgi:predicted dehydrogenase
MKQSRVAIVSATGSGWKRTIPALFDSELCQVSAVHGRDPARLRALADEFAIPAVFTDLSEMIDAGGFDFAVVCSPPFMHRAQVEALVSSGVPVLVEKPLAVTIADGLAISALASAVGVEVRIAHHLRHQNLFRQMKELLASGAIGDAMHAELEWSFRMNRTAPSARWKLDPQLNGRTSLSDAGVHCLDLAVALFGPAEVLSATARGRSENGVLEDVDLTLQQGGVLTHVVASRLYGPFSNSLRVSCSEGEIFGRQFFTEKSSPTLEVHDSSGIRILQGREGNPYREEVEDFARTLFESGYTSNCTSLIESLQALTIIDHVEAIIGQFEGL